MNVSKRRIIIILLGLILLLSSSIIIMLNKNAANVAFANIENNETELEDFIIEDYGPTNIAAILDYSILNDTDCCVRITNKTEATKANIPSHKTINGKVYNVTEVAANGFMSAKKLIRVSLPASIKKIGSMAFRNCTSLKRISIGNVEEIGNSAFYGCINLSYLVIPESAKTIGSTILRNCNTQVRVRAESEGSGWSSSWNANNQNQDVEYGSQYYEKFEYELKYNTNSSTRSSEIEGLIVAAGQPRTDKYYAIKINVDDEKKITIPAELETEDYGKLEIKAINSEAFKGVYADKIIVEYSETPIILDSNAFSESISTTIIINRQIIFLDLLTNVEATYIFSDCEYTTTIVLPDSITGLTENMFFCCFSLTNIYFVEVTAENDCNTILKHAKENLIKIIKEEEGRDIEDEDVMQIVFLPKNTEFVSIGESAFYATCEIKELHIFDNVKNVDDNVLDDWNDYSQIVYVHNTNKITYKDSKQDFGWSRKWKASFSNVVFLMNYFTIKFEPNGAEFADDISGNFEKNYGSDGVTISSVSIEVPSKFVFNELPDLTRDNYKFVGWIDNEGNPYELGEQYTIDSDLTLKADWAAIYTIKFNLDDGKFNDGENEEIKVVYGEKIGYLPTPVYGIHVFSGWYLNGRLFTEETVYNLDCNILLTAKWTYFYTINFITNGGEVSQKTKIVEYNKEIGELPTPYYEKHVFGGWFFGDEQFTETTDYQFKTDMTLFARWYNAYTITFDGNGFEVLPKTMVVAGTQPVGKLPEPSYEKDKHIFGGWFFDSKEFKETTIYDIEKDITLKAYWSCYHSVDFNSTDANVSIESKRILHGNAMVELPEIALEHHNFEGWYHNGIMYNKDIITDDITLTAQWQKIDYIITFDANGGTVSRTTQTVHYGEAIGDLPIPDYDVNEFDGWWYEGTKYEADTDYLFGDGITLKAKWKNRCSIIYDLDGGVNSKDNPDEYEFGTSKILIDATHSTLDFDGWYYNNEKITNLNIINGKNEATGELINVIIISAKWVKSKTIYINEAFSILNVDCPDTTIIFDRYFSNDCEIVISLDVETVTIIGYGYTYNLSIKILSVNLLLTLDNISIQAPNNKYAIEMKPELTYATSPYRGLYLYTQNTVSILGSTDNSTNGNAANGKPAIFSNCELYINRADNLTIQGGNGENGNSGTSLVISPFDGVNGGAGAPAIFTNSNVNISCSNLTIKAGKAGNGYGRGYGGAGAAPIIGVSVSPKVNIGLSSSRIYLLASKDGIDGASVPSWSTGSKPTSPFPSNTAATVVYSGPNGMMQGQIVGYPAEEGYFYVYIVQ